MPMLDYPALRTTVSIKQVLELLRYRPHSRHGQQLRGPCPLHGSAWPGSSAFSISLESNLFMCFKCGMHGNHLDLWRMTHNLPLYEASLDLCERLGIEPPLLDPEKPNS